MVRRVYELDCLNINLRPYLYGDVQELPYKLGYVRAVSRDPLILTGHAHGRPLEVTMPVRRVGWGRVGYRQAACPNCPRWARTLRVFPDGALGCRQCRPYRRRGYDELAAPYRRRPKELMHALENGTPWEKELAMRALRCGPIRGKRPTRFPSKRLLRGDYELWPEELLTLRLLWTGMYPWE